MRFDLTEEQIEFLEDIFDQVWECEESPFERENIMKFKELIFDQVRIK